MSMTLQAANCFSFEFEGVLITGTADKDSSGKFLTETIGLDEQISEDDFQSEAEFWGYVDRLCVAFDCTGLFDQEVNSVHLV